MGIIVDLSCLRAACMHSDVHQGDNTSIYRAYDKVVATTSTSAAKSAGTEGVTKMIDLARAAVITVYDLASQLKAELASDVAELPPVKPRSNHNRPAKKGKRSRR